MTRLKRYIRACGAHRNYKKLLGSCRSHKERLSVLRAELEALGMKGEARSAWGLQEGYPGHEGGGPGARATGEGITSLSCPR